MRKAAILLVLISLTFLGAVACDKSDNSDEYTFYNNSTHHTVYVYPSGQIWISFSMSPGDSHEINLADRYDEPDFTYSPDSSVRYTRDGHKIIFVDR